MNTQTPITIRRMTHDDVETVESIDRRSFPLPWPPGSYRAELDKKPFARCWVAERDGLIAGMLVGWLIQGEFQIATIAVAPEARRAGVGKMLLEHSMSHAAAEGATYFTLEARAGNKSAISLYRAFGFRIVGRRSGSYQDGEEAVLMERGEMQV